MRVKICGINSEASFDAVVAAGADYLGFVFSPPSPRAISAATARALSARAPGGPRRVGLFVNPTPTDIAAVLESVQLDVLQIHGLSEVHDFRRFGLPIWRAVGVEQPTDLPHDLAGADEFLLDAKPPKGATRPGGNATAFDWSLLLGWQATAPWWLAGGLTPDNVAHAIKYSGATAVDVSSGVESAPGVKDAGLIARFVKEARGK